MRKFLFSIVVVLTVADLTAATTLTFDDLPSAAMVPNGYGGFTWSNMYYIGGPNHPNSGYANAVVSANNVAFNGGGDPAAAFDGTFNFLSAYLTGAWNDGLNVTVMGLLNSVSLYSQSVVVNTSGPTFFNFNYVGIDEVRFRSFGGVPNPNFGGPGSGTHFAMDNFTFTIPEPVTLVLAAMSLMCIGCCRRRRSPSPTPA